MRIRDKIITTACLTTTGMEWTTLKVKPDGTEPVLQSSLPLELPDDMTKVASIQLSAELTEHLKGEVTVALRSSELLMRTMEFPTTDLGEIADMVGFQIDKTSPFPLDQMEFSYEILDQSAETAQVLMVAAKHDRIDTIGDTFEEKGVRIHSIDARALGWLQLLRDQDHLSADGCEILIVVDGIDFVLIVMLNGLPIAFRSLHTQLDDMAAIDELSEELVYTLTTLDVEQDLPAPSAIQFWNIDSVPAPLRAKLSEKCGIKVLYHDLGVLPPLSEGIIRRALNRKTHIELIPREWVDHQKRKQLNRKFGTIAGGIVALWLVVTLVFFSIHKARDIQLNRVKADAEAIAPAAQQAQENQNKLKALKVYTDRSDSALECLREITRMLPAGDIEFVSYNYKKEKGVTLRGTARTDDTVYDFFETLTDSTLFDHLKDQRVDTKTTKGVRRAIFSVTLQLPTEEKDK